MRTFSLVLAGFFIVWAFFTCASPSSKNKTTNRTDNSDVTTVISKEASEGLDLQLLIPIVREAKDAEDLEKRINEENGINNLDLNDDGKVDFIKVTEFGSKDAYGFSLTCFPEDGQEQEVATIEIKKDDQGQAEVQVAGNQQIYGQNHYHHSRFGVGEMLLMAYLIRPHSYYYSPYRWGYYPPFYRPYSYRSHSVYNSYRTNYSSSYWSRQPSAASVTRTTRSINTGLTSPNANKVASSGIKTKLSNPTKSQKAFTARSATKSVKSGGFGRNSSSSSSTKSSSSNVRSTSSRGFGGRGK